MIYGEEIMNCSSLLKVHKKILNTGEANPKWVAWYSKAVLLYFFFYVLAGLN